MVDTTFFEKASIRKLFFKIAIPGAIGMLFSAVYVIIDGFFVSYYLGQTAFSAVNIVWPFIYIMFAFSDMVGVGSSVIMSIRLGEKRKEEANQIFTFATLFILAFSFTLSIISYFSAPLLLDLMGATGELKTLGVEYLQTYVIFLPFSSIIFAVDNFLRVCGKTKTSMSINIAMSLTIVLLEYLFLGVFKWGIFASALASSLAFMIYSTIAYLPFLLKKLEIQFSFPSITKKDIKLIFKNGLPILLNNIAGKLPGIFFNILLLEMVGEKGVSAYGTLMYIECLIIPVLYGMCDSLQPAIGYNYGANRMDRVKKIEIFCLTAAFFVCLLSFFILFFFPEPLALIFTDETLVETVKVTSLAIVVYSFTYLTRWISFALQSFFAATSRPIEATFISLTISCFSPLVLIGVFYTLSDLGIWLNFPVSSLITAIVALLIALVKWKKKTLFLENKDNKNS